MVKAELGDKQVCPNCGAKFYDLRRRPATCPKCATSFDPGEESGRVRRTRAKVTSLDLEDEEEEVEAAVADEEEEEAEETAEIDVEAVEPVVTAEEDEETEASGEELPPGFSEEEAELEDEAADTDDSVPLLEDEEEFPADEIGELPAEEDEEGGG